jgi:regulatory protein
MYFRSMTNKAQLTLKQALLKAANYCAYQERCYAEVEEKLADWGIFGTDAGELLIQLSEQGYLNEERFARAFAGGKFRTKQWGRVRIKNELKMRKISDYCIRKGLEEIEDDSYLQTLSELAHDKWAESAGKNMLIRKQKTINYLMQKGFEADLVRQIVFSLPE